jgi:hypothetical protein
MIGAYVLAGILTLCVTMLCVTFIAKWALDYAKQLETQERPDRLLSPMEAVDLAQDEFKRALKRSEALSSMADRLRGEGRQHITDGFDSLASKCFRRAAIVEDVAKRLRLGQCTVVESDELLAKRL